jgi:1,4-alpha-glucan branching enzyme
MKVRSASARWQAPKPTQPALQPGMGAIPTADGVTFRVWAPNADSVAVAGSFNEWSKTAHRLAAEGNGYWSTVVKEAQPGQEYRYLLTNGDQELWRIDPYAREVTNSIGNSVITQSEFDWEGDRFQLAPWNELVIYEMHLGTFHDKREQGPGTLQTALEKLPYLQELGINVIEIMPMAEFPGSFSWGYNPSYPFAIESDYGGPQALKEFVKRCHQQGIGVIVDVVYNHFGPGDLELWAFDGWSENGAGGIYFYNDWRGETPWGHTRPDYGRNEVRRYLRDNVLMWFQDYHVDGLRWDATAYIRNVHGNGNPAEDLPDGWGFMQWIHEEIAKIYPNALTIAEDLRNNEWLIKDVGAGGAGFGAQWDPEFVHPVRAAITTIDDNARDLDAIRGALEHRYGDDAFQRVIYTESHDEVANGKVRVPEEISPGNVDNWFARKRSALGAALVLTAPGIPMLFQGQEFLEDRWFHDQDPLEWARAESYPGLVMLHRDLICLRRNLDGTTRGLCGQQVAVHHVNQQRKVIAFHRWDQGGPNDSVIVVANLAHQPLENYAIGLPRAGLWQVRLNSDWNGYDAEFGTVATNDVTALEGECDGLPFHAPLNVGPYSVVILSQAA